MGQGVRPPEGYIWLWLVKGFDGIFSLADKWLSQGVPPTPELKAGLIDVRNRLNSLINRLP